MEVGRQRQVLRDKTVVLTLADPKKQAWIKATTPTTKLLEGKTVAIKDNTAVAGVRCTNGSTMVEWTPEYDATIVTRILDAGGLILGKSGRHTLQRRAESSS